MAHGKDEKPLPLVEYWAKMVQLAMEDLLLIRLARTLGLGPAFLSRYTLTRNGKSWIQLDPYGY